MRPFGSRESLLSAARREWDALTEDDWREAFTHHPKIGDRAGPATAVSVDSCPLDPRAGGSDGAPDDVLDALAEGNRRYEETFGYIFIVCASGRSAEEMLAMLTARLGNDPAHEIRIAAGEQAKITALRLGSSA